MFDSSRANPSSEALLTLTFLPVSLCQNLINLYSTSYSVKDVISDQIKRSEFYLKKFVISKG